MLKEDDPRGTLEELEALGADVAKVPCCARKVMDEGSVVIRGCHEFKRCTLKERGAGGVGETRKGGPVNKGLQVLKKKADGTAIVSNVLMTCYHIPGFKRRIEEAGGVVNVIATEGETMHVRGSKFRDEMIPGQGLVRIVDDVVIPTEVKKFPRPGETGNLSEQVLAGQIMAAHKSKLAKALPFDLLGLKDEAKTIMEADGGKTEDPAS